MTKSGDDKTLRAKEFAAQLSNDTARQVLDEINDQDDVQIDPFRRALIEKLNVLRPYRARRLFTSLIEPFIHRDDLLLTGQQSIPYQFHLYETAGLWAVLARQAFLEVAVDTAHAIDAMCLTMVVNAALETPPILEGRERMRLQTLAYIQQLLTHRSALEQFLARVAAVRDQEIKKTDENGIQDQPFPRERLIEFHQLLTVAPQLTDRVIMARSQIMTNTDYENAAKDLNTEEATLKSSLGEAGLPIETATALPLSLLTSTAPLDIIGLYLHRRGLTNARLVAEGLVVKARVLCRALGHGFERLIPPGVARTTPLNTEEGQTQIEATATTVTAFEHLLRCLKTAGLTEDPRLRPQVDTVLGAMLRTLVSGKNDSQSPLGRLLLRVFAALTDSNDRAVADFDIIRSACRLTRRLQTSLVKAEIVSPELSTFRSRIVREAKIVLPKAIHIEGADVRPGDIGAHPEDVGEGETPTHNAELERKFAHICRLEAIVETFGQSITDGLTVLSLHTQIIIHHRLDDPRPLDKIALKVIVAFLSIARAELKAIKYWRNPDLVTLSEAGKQRGL